MLKIKRIKKANICGVVFDIKWDSSIGGASFDVTDAKIVIGTKYSDQDIFDSIIHEISEVAHCVLNQRFYREDVSSDYMFCFNHAGHTAHSTLVAGAIPQFLA